jgi:hypothetical protein
MELIEKPSTSYWGHLWRVEAAVAISLALYGFALAVLVWLGAAALAPSTPGIGGAFALILWFGAIPSIVFYAPTYTLLRWTGFANLAAAVALGILCGLVFARSGPLALFAIPCGAIVAAASHLMLERVR